MSERVHSTADDHLLHITVERVLHPDILQREWYPLFVDNFPDEGDREPLEQLLERLHNEPSTFFFLARDGNGKPLGQEMGQLTSTGAVYIPYSATRAGDRNKGVNPAVSTKLDEIYKEAGGTHCLIDVEDTRAIQAGVYRDYIDQIVRDLMNKQRISKTQATEDAERSALEIIVRRQDFWRRRGYQMVTDCQLPYIRPASDDDSKLQAYDTLIFRLLDPEAAKWRGLFNAEKTAISLDFYKHFYLEITRAQYGELSEQELRRQLPAVDTFLEAWHERLEAGKQWSSIRTDSPRPNKHRTAEIYVTITDARAIDDEVIGCPN